MRVRTHLGCHHLKITQMVMKYSEKRCWMKHDITKQLSVDADCSSKFSTGFRFRFAWMKVFCKQFLGFPLTFELRFRQLSTALVAPRARPVLRKCPCLWSLFVEQRCTWSARNGGKRTTTSHNSQATNIYNNHRGQLFRLYRWSRPAGVAGTRARTAAASVGTRPPAQLGENRSSSR